MTIITKPISEKKDTKGGAPLAPPTAVNASAPVEEDVESQASLDPSILILRARARRVSTTTTLCLLIVALVVVGMGIIGGTYLYREYMRSHIFRGNCLIPYDESQAMFLQDNFTDEELQQLDSEILEQIRKAKVFNEEFEIDTVNEDYEKIEVPDFKDGRAGRFVHDFNQNKTGIIDVSGHRCFVMPLNRDNVLQPKSMVDLIQKMWNGYYMVDTQVIRETMKVIVPPITDREEVGSYISKECEGYPIYKLEKFVSGVWKRSADLGSDAKWAQFSGKNILEFDIMNLHEVEEYEKNMKH